ncbi:hypothetical protein OSTOST_07725 [Ostertagia ostertagi]
MAALDVSDFSQGATYFYVYTKYIDEYSRVLLDDYIRTGEAEAVILHDRFQRADDRWQAVELQECLLRARRHSRWIAFIDLDERLTMTQYNGTIYDYLKCVEVLISFFIKYLLLKTFRIPKIGAIQYRQRWILKNESMPERYEGDQQLLKVLVMSVHYVQKFFDDYILHRLDPKEGVVRHYRDVKSGNWGKVWLKGVERMGNFSMTDYPELYSAPLLKNVQDRVRFVYGGISQNTTIK